LEVSCEVEIKCTVSGLTCWIIKIEPGLSNPQIWYNFKVLPEIQSRGRWSGRKKFRTRANPGTIELSDACVLGRCDSNAYTQCKNKQLHASGWRWILQSNASELTTYVAMTKVMTKLRVRGWACHWTWHCDDLNRTMEAAIKRWGKINTVMLFYVSMNDIWSRAVAIIS